MATTRIRTSKQRWRCEGGVRYSTVMPGQPGPAFGRPGYKLVPGIYVFLFWCMQGVDGRDKPGHDKREDGGVSLAIRAARPADSALIFALVRELADYEKLSAEVEATEQQIAAALFDEPSRISCDIAEWDGAPAGFAVWFLNFSTFRGRPGLYLEDIFVRPTFRQRGIGKALLKRLAQRCSEQGYARFEWAVLDWNAPAIAFYKSLGAQVLDEWRICRLSGAALQSFAGEGTAR